MAFDPNRPFLALHPLIHIRVPEIRLPVAVHGQGIEFPNRCGDEDALDQGFGNPRLGEYIVQIGPVGVILAVIAHGYIL
ncbi:hypothetical protein D3C76_1736480 [compost metagenome]